MPHVATGQKNGLTGVEVSTLFLDSAYRGGDPKNWTILQLTGVKKSKKFFCQKNIHKCFLTDYAPLFFHFIIKYFS